MGSVAKIYEKSAMFFFIPGGIAMFKKNLFSGKTKQNLRHSCKTQVTSMNIFLLLTIQYTKMLQGTRPKSKNKAGT